MKTIWAFASLILIIAGSAPLVGKPADPGIVRNNLLREDLSTRGREAVQVLVEFAPGAEFPSHSHPGEELVFIVKGALEYVVDGKPAVMLDTGDVLFIPAGAIHSVRNVGEKDAAELATYIVEKGKPLLIPAN